MKDKELIAFWEDAVSKGNETFCKGWGMYLTGGHANATLDLIKRLKIQSNGYRNKEQAQKGELARLYKQVAEQKAEIERLQAVVDAELDTIHKLGDDYERALEEQELVKTAKAEAIKEYAWRFEKKIETSPYMSVALKYTMLKNTRQIKDNLVKEMVGDAE